MSSRLRAANTVAGWVGVAIATSLPAQASTGQANRLVPVPEVRDRQGKLTVVDEQIVVRCREHARYVLTCASEATLTVRNEVGEPVPLTLEADLLAGLLEIDGTAVPLVPNLSRMLQLADAVIPTGSHEIRLVIPTALHRDLSPELDLFDRVLNDRHPLAAEHPGEPFTAEITIQSAKKVRRWSRVEQTTVELTYPDRWHWRPSAEAVGPPPPCPPSGGPASGLEGCSRDAPTGEPQAVWTFTSSDRSWFERSIPLMPPSSIVAGGGPLFGATILGRSDDWDWAEAARVWAGYELGITDMFLLGILAEYSGAERFTAIPTLDVAILMQVGAIPAITAGLALPGRLWPEPELGFRLQLAASWTLGSTVSLGVVVPVEWFPGSASGAYPYAGGGVQLGM